MFARERWLDRTQPGYRGVRLRPYRNPCHNDRGGEAMSVDPSARTIVFFIRRLDNVEIMVLKLRLSMRSMRIFQLSNKHSFCISEILSAYKNEANKIKRILVVKIKNQNMIIPWLEALSAL